MDVKKPIKATCNLGCQETFTIKRFRRKMIIDDIEKVYFRCPECGFEYTCFFTNEKIKKMQMELNDLFLFQRNDIKKNYEQSTRNIIERTRAMIKNEMERLKNEFGET